MITDILNLFFNATFPESGVCFTLNSGQPHLTSHLWLGATILDSMAPEYPSVWRCYCVNPYSLLVIRSPACTAPGRLQSIYRRSLTRPQSPRAFTFPTRTCGSFSHCSQVYHPELLGHISRASGWKSPSTQQALKADNVHELFLEAKSQCRLQREGEALEDVALLPLTPGPAICLALTPKPVYPSDPFMFTDWGGGGGTFLSNSGSNKASGGKEKEQKGAQEGPEARIDVISSSLSKGVMRLESPRKAAIKKKGWNGTFFPLDWLPWTSATRGCNSGQLPKLQAKALSSHFPQSPVPPE